MADPASAKVAPWLVEARKYLGEREIKGSRNNPLIVQWGKDAGISWWANDDDAWCAVFVGGMLAASSLPTTRSALARSYLEYGVKLDPRHPVPGAIAVFPRGSSTLYGHVGIVEEVTATTVVLVNGNVSDMVRRSTFSRAAIIGLSWPADVPLPQGAVRMGGASGAAADGVLRQGASGPAVKAFQRNLNVLGYGLKETGRLDFATTDAVKRFQARRALKADGEAGPATLSALDAAVKAKAAETKPLPDGKAAKSGTIQGAVGAIAGGGLAVSTAVDAARQVAEVNAEAAPHFAAGTWLGIAIGVVMVSGGLFLVWSRLREADRLPSWLGGKPQGDDLPELKGESAPLAAPLAGPFAKPQGAGA